MEKTTIIGLVLVAVFFVLPILNGNSIIPISISEIEVGEFIGGIIGYWIGVVEITIATIKG